MSCNSSLCIIDASFLSNIWLANTSPHSVGGVFALFMMVWALHFCGAFPWSTELLWYMRFMNKVEIALLLKQLCQYLHIKKCFSPTSNLLSHRWMIVLKYNTTIVYIVTLLKAQEISHIILEKCLKILVNYRITWSTS